MICTSIIFFFSCHLPKNRCKNQFQGEDTLSRYTIGGCGQPNLQQIFSTPYAKLGQAVNLSTGTGFLLLVKTKPLQWVEHLAERNLSALTAQKHTLLSIVFHG